MIEPLTAGIYRVRDEEKKISFIGYSYNICGLFKRFRFELGLNACSVKPLQAMYNRAGGRVNMEILEEIPVCGANDADGERHLKSALCAWRDKLDAYGETVRVILL